MLSRIDATNAGGTILNLLLEDPSSGYVVAEVEGLDPVKANLVSSPFANMDGEQYHSSRRDLRNIVMKIDLEPDYITTSVSDLRNRLYRFFMPKSTVKLAFVMDSGQTYTISGIVETCESTIFSKDPQMTISVMCFDPDFVVPVPIVLSGSTVNVTTGAGTALDYAGTVETGATLVVNINRSASEITIYHTTPDGLLRSMEVAYPFLTGDVLTVVTEPGNKSVSLKRSNVTTSILYATPPRAYWVELQQGLNYYQIYVTGAAIPYTLQYSARYGGL